MADPVLTFEGVSLRSEQGRVLLDDVHWALPKGGRARLRHGGDAAPVLRLAAGLLHPEAGRVVLDGIGLGPYAFDHPFLRRGALGWVPRGGGLLVNQSLLANVALPLMFSQGVPRMVAERRSAQALEEAGLLAAAELRPHALEAQERWLGSLVRATLMAPELWLVELPSAQVPGPAMALLERALASGAAILAAGGEAWLPPEAMPGLAWVDGRLVPGEA